MFGCANVTSVDLPESMEKFSFREFSKMSLLESISLRSASPIVTAKSKDEGVFVILVANPTVKVNVPKAALKDYKKALAVADGEYFENSPKATIPYAVMSGGMVTAKNLSGVKSFKE